MQSVIKKGRFNNNKWYIFGRGQGINYGGIPKLLAPEISLGGNFMFDSNGHFYSTTKIYGYIKKDSCKYSYKFLLGLLNSSLFWFFIQKTGYVLRGGYYTFKTNYVSPFPIPCFDSTDKIKIGEVEKYVEVLIDPNKPLTKEKILDIMKRIDSAIYNIYYLSNDEINTIEMYTKI